MGLLGGIKNWVMPDDDSAQDAQAAATATSADGKVKIRIETPRDFVEAASLLADLKANSCLLVNLNQADGESRRRIYDYLDGARAFAGGNVAEIASDVYMFSLQDSSSVEKKFTGQNSAFQFEELKKRYLS